MINEVKLENLIIREYLPHGEVKKVVIGVHGFAGDQDSSVLMALGKLLSKKDICLITFDLPCHGQNANKGKLLSLADCENTLEEVVDFARNKFNCPINFFATSFGAYLLLLYLSKSKDIFEGKIVLRAPAIFMDQVFEDVLLGQHGYTLQDLKQKELNFGYASELLVNYRFFEDLLANKLENFHFNFAVNVIQGKQDDVVDWQKNEKFFKQKFKDRHKLYYFDKAGHRFKNHGELEKIVEIADNIFN